MKTTVGREHELQRMERLFAEVAGGAGRTCFISGEAGSGKSTLVQEFVARALDARDDVIVAIGSCDAQIGIGDP
ncbi:MAG TPA: ATP-binding protein, partial [Thermoanaerobaculia bacterium]|nr:ATP-binding protein [Thermoanaerobaculia bacterium]